MEKPLDDIQQIRRLIAHLMATVESHAEEIERANDTVDGAVRAMVDEVAALTSRLERIEAKLSRHK